MTERRRLVEIKECRTVSLTPCDQHCNFPLLVRRLSKSSLWHIQCHTVRKPKHVFSHTPPQGEFGPPSCLQWFCPAYMPTTSYTCYLWQTYSNSYTVHGLLIYFPPENEPIWFLEWVLIKRKVWILDLFNSNIFITSVMNTSDYFGQYIKWSEIVKF